MLVVNRDKQEKKWYAMYVASRQEKKVLESVLQTGLDAYVPFVKTMKQWSDRKKMVEVPLFNGYVFVQHALHEKEKLFHIPGIVSYVCFDKKPAEIKEKDMQVMKNIVALGYETVVANASMLATGTDVKIIQGDFKGLSGTILKKGKHSFFIVALDAIQQQVMITLPAAILEKI